MNKTSFITRLSSHGLVLTEKQQQQFAFYYERLVAENDKYNLTAIVDEEEVYEKHFYDSLSVLFGHSLKDVTLLDVGAGAGFPSMPLKIAEPSLRVSVLDSTMKKVRFIEQLAKDLSLTPVTSIVARAEEYRQQQFDVVVARGVASLPILLELVCQLVKPNGYFIAYKGASFESELAASQNACRQLGFVLEKKQIYTLPSQQAQRCNLFFKKSRDNDRIYPRPYAKIKQKPL